MSHNENEDSLAWLDEKTETEKDTRKFHAPPRSTSFFDRILGRKSQSPSPSPSSGSKSSSASYRESSLPPLSPLTLKGYKTSTRNRILDAELAENIRNLLPARTQLYDEWELVYSLEQHGISLKTLYRNCDPRYQREQSKKKKAESGFADGVIKNMIVGSNTNSQDTTQRSQGYVLVIKDEKGNKFGSFLNENLKPVDTKRYYGNGECFLWKCENYYPGNLSHSNNSSEKSDAIDGETIAQDIPSAAKEGGRDTKVSTRFKAFMYTGINASIIYSNQHFIAIGSSDGHNGLWIDQSLYNGVSCVCETFGNEVLNDSDPHSKVGKFKIMSLEVWRVGAL